MKQPNYQLIEDFERLSQVCHELKKSAFIAVDTEFMRERTFYPIPGLIQLADPDNIYLIDPLKIDTVQPFLDLLENPFVTKVMHSASEDIELFYAMGCMKPQAIFDTQIAASWLGAGLSLSLANLVAFHAEIELDKSQTRTNWLTRPLSSEQLNYAALDVAYLIDIAHKQQELLNSLNFMDYVKEDNDLACEAPDSDLTMAYLQVKGAHSLQDRELGKLSLLAEWRERVARRDDRPKSHVLKDQELIRIAGDVNAKDDLKQIDLHPAARRRYSDEIMAVISEQTIPNDCKPVVRLQDLNNGRQLLKHTKTAFMALAKQKGLPTEVMPSKRWLEAIILYNHTDWYPKPRLWKGWRENLLAPLLDKTAQELDVHLKEPM